MAIHASLTMQDSFGRVTTKRIETTKTVLADAQADIASYATDLNAVTDLQLLRVTYSMVDDGDAFAGAVSSNVDVGATFTVVTSDGGNAAHKIPGFPLALVGGNGSIDVTQIEVTNYFDNFDAAAGLRLSDGESVTSILRGQLDK